MDTSTMQLTPEIFFGALAFILTSVYCTLSFPLMLRLIAKNTTRRWMVSVFFLCAVLMHSAWLVYLWPLENLFIRIGGGLQVLVNLVFLLQIIFFRRGEGRDLPYLYRKQNKHY